MEAPNVSYNEPRATPMLEKAFEELFRDHEELSNFIMERGNLFVNLDDLRRCAKAGEDGSNSPNVRWLHRFIEAMEDELKEMKESIPWKWWRNEKADLQNVRVEIIDLFHFLLSAAAASGMTGEDFINIYYQKRRLNYDRQINGFKKNDNEFIGKDRF